MQLLICTELLNPPSAALAGALPGLSGLCQPQECSLLLAGDSRLRRVSHRGHPVCHVLGWFWEERSWSLQDWGPVETQKMYF